MDKFHLEIDGLQIEIIPKAIKNIYLRIFPPHAHVQMTVPKNLSVQHIRSQIETKRLWIDKKRQLILSQPPRVEVLQSGATVYFLGKPYYLDLIFSSHSGLVKLNENKLELHVKPSSNMEYHSKVLKKWYRTEMEARLPSLISYWEQRIGVRISQWGIKSMKTRWGSCNIRQKRIWLNLELIKKSLDCLESVLVHELVHLLERNHNARFYKFMDEFMPEWRHYQNELKMI